jgi:PAS domain S-box-containing protein
MSDLTHLQRFRCDFISDDKSDLSSHERISISQSNLDGIIFYVNNTFCQESGYSFNELIGINQKLFISKLHSNNFHQEIADFISRGEIWQGEMCNYHKNGDDYWSSISISPLFDKLGFISGSTSIRFKITPKKQLIIDNTFKARQFDSLVSGLDAFCHLDSLGNFIDLSENFLKLYLYPRSLLFSQPFSFLELKDRNSDIENILTHLLFDYPETIESCHIDMNSSIIHIRIMFIRQLDSSINCFIWNISPQIKKEIESKKTLISAFHYHQLKIVEFLSTGVQLHFNNLMTSISGYNEFNQSLAQNLITDFCDYEQINYELLDNTIQIRNAVSRTKFIFDNLFSFFNPDQIDDLSPVIDFNCFIENILLFIRHSFLSSYKLTFDLSETRYLKFSSLITKGDLKIIFLNLSIFSRDSFFAGKGEISVKTRSIQQSSCLLHSLSTLRFSSFAEFHFAKYDPLSISSSTNSFFLEITIIDNGVGICQSVLDKVFDIFNSSSISLGGKGIGVSMVCDVVDKLSGHFFINSIVDVGTEVRLYFPISYT